MVEETNLGKTHVGTRICALCVAVADSTRHVTPFLHNQKLLETNRFIVLPSLGPLMPGHVMVVGREHQNSLASMGREALEEYEELANRLRVAPFLRDGVPLEAEHGSTANDKAGACVVHTHVHWLPGLGGYLRDFQKRLPLLCVFSAELRRSEAVPLGHPVMPVFDGLGG